MNVLPFYDGRYVKTKKRTYVDKVFMNFHGLNVPHDDIECKSFTVISIDSLLLCKTNVTCKYIYKIVLIKL